MSRTVLTLKNLTFLRIYMTSSIPTCIAKVLLRAATDLVTHQDVLLHLTHIRNYYTHFSNTASTVYYVG